MKGKNSISKFFKKLEKHYSKPIKGTKFVVKFYAQAQTFSFELHDRRNTCFTPDSLVHESDVYSFWIQDRETRDVILNDIKDKAKELSKLSKKLLEKRTKEKSWFS